MIVIGTALFKGGFKGRGNKRMQHKETINNPFSQKAKNGNSHEGPSHETYFLFWLFISSRYPQQGFWVPIRLITLSKSSDFYQEQKPWKSNKCVLN